MPDPVCEGMILNLARPNCINFAIFATSRTSIHRVMLLAAITRAGTMTSGQVIKSLRVFWVRTVPRSTLVPLPLLPLPFVLVFMHVAASVHAVAIILITWRSALALLSPRIIWHDHMILL